MEKKMETGIVQWVLRIKTCQEITLDMGSLS